MTAHEAGEVYSRRQIREEAIRALGSCDESRRLTDPGQRAPEQATAQTQDPPRMHQRSRRARYEGLPLHAPRPALVDTPVIVPPLPPRPHGQYYAPGWPAGPSQPYVWPPHQGFPHSQYPPWFSGPPMDQQGYSVPPITPQGFIVPPMRQHGYSAPPTFQTGYSVPPSGQQGFTPSTYYGYPGEGSSQPFAGLDTFTEDFRPQFPEPGMATPSAFSSGFMQESHSTIPMGIISHEDPSDGDDDGDDPSDDDEDGDDDGDATRTPVVRRNPGRGARERCPLSSYEHTQRRCRDYHARPRDGRQ